MRILLVTYEYPGVTDNCGGGGRVAQLLERGLDARGHEVRTVTDCSDGHWATWPARSVWRLRRAIRDWQPDVVHGCFALPTSPALPTLCARYNVPLCISVMGADIYDPTRFGWVRPLANRVTAYILRRADAVVAPSSDMAHRTASLLSEPPDIIHYGIDADTWRWQPRELTEPIDVLTVARLVERKHLQTGIDAVARLRDRGYEARYTIVGTGPRADVLQARADSLPWLSLPGYVADIEAAYHDADVFLLPSLHEAFGLVVLEALACGLPVVVSDTGGQTDLLAYGDVGAIAPPRDAPLAGALTEVCDLYEHYQRATREYVATWFDYEYMVDEYETLYARLADTTTPSQRRVRP